MACTTPAAGGRAVKSIGLRARTRKIRVATTGALPQTAERRAHSTGSILD
jgi:hypothetical protein